MKNTLIALITIILLSISSVTFAAEECLLCETAKHYTVLEVEKLLENDDIDADDEDQNGETALIWAAGNSQIKIVKVLLENGANVNHRNKNGETALMRAALSGRIEVVKILLYNGANVNYKIKQGILEGWRALDLTAHSEVAKVLLECGADPNIKLKGSKGEISAILEKYLKEVEEGREFPPCEK